MHLGLKPGNLDPCFLYIFICPYRWISSPLTSYPVYCSRSYCIILIPSIHKVSSYNPWNQWQSIRIKRISKLWLKFISKSKLWEHSSYRIYHMSLKKINHSEGLNPVLTTVQIQVLLNCKPKEKKKRNMYSCPRNRPRKHMELCDVEISTFSRQSAHRCRSGIQSCAPAAL